MTLNEFLAHFNNVKGTGNGQYKALCPAHEDHNPAYLWLVQRWQEGFTPLLCGLHRKRHYEEGGFDYERFDMKQKDSSQAEVRKQTYKYVDAEGTLLYRRIRTDYINAKIKVSQQRGKRS